MIFWLLVASAQAEPDPAEEAVKAKIAEFNAAFKAASNDQERAAAFVVFSDIHHDKIIREVEDHLDKGGDLVRQAAAQTLAAYRENRKAADALLKAAKAQKDSGLRVTFIEAYGQTACAESGKLLVPFIKDKLLHVSKAAVDAAGQARAVEFVEPLIELYVEVEKLPDGDPSRLEKPEEERGDQPWRRKAVLLDPIKVSLEQITDQKFQSAAGYADWWRDNKKTFKVKPRGP